jgi:hypothetical protein
VAIGLVSTASERVEGYRSVVLRRRRAERKGKKKGGKVGEVKEERGRGRILASDSRLK